MSVAPVFRVLRIPAPLIGNADAVRLAVDGEPYAIPRVGREGNLARFAVDIAEE